MRDVRKSSPKVVSGNVEPSRYEHVPPTRERTVPLSIMLAQPDAAWASLLGSEGVSWNVGLPAKTAHDAPPVWILPSDIASRVASECQEQVWAGGAAICEPGVPHDQRKEPLEEVRFSFHNGDFAGLEGPTHPDSVRIQIYRLGRGRLLCLPFRLASLWNSWARARHFVAIGDGELIWSDMAAIVKRNVRRVVVDVLKSCFFGQGLPYVHKAYYPGSYRSVFCFRGDADGGPRENLQRWLNVVGEHASATTLFFCTHQYEANRDLIARAAANGIEIGSHNHWHIVFPDSCTNAISLRRAERVLATECGRPKGFAAPAYFWHPSLYRLLEKRGYNYATCFRLNHDSIPYYPAVGGQLGSVLEFPYHCLGDAFPRHGIPLNSELPSRFFKNLIDKKYAAGEPMLLYGHPDMDGRMGSAPGLVRSIFESALAHSDVKPWQLGEYARWWRKRDEIDVKLRYNPRTMELTCDPIPRDVGADDVALQVEFPDGATFLADPVACSQMAQPRAALKHVASYRLPGATDLGELVHCGSYSRRPFDGRTAKRFLLAYRNVYSDCLGRFLRTRGDE